ncbi:MAG TPA: hypothetical protein DIW27_06995, partial [Cytophagales bacterium]|nr:hypothetical protein [Cytophagales bacterium]
RSNQKWIALNDLKQGAIYRFSNEEIILRFFAFNAWLDSYTGRLAKFLNDYRSENRNPSSEFLTQRETLFNSTLEIIQQKIFNNQAFGKMSKATLEGLLVGVSRNIENLKTKPAEQVLTLYNEFRALPDFSIENLKEGLSGKDKVTNRINSAIQVFAK